ncbi:bifunctional methyltransferase/pyrophosphohydrolase YabN [Anaerosinus gibii]|uniref:Nucleoside triphosphate pyrophosphohydrolase n=1 Tax=Selenobaculum gibii TaxID=3054208 RepID=A0A9Y2ETA2_9FIRM|nr:nucleoside triphosphate pyrophosphohydrolase [Selenobaculum gbiensis]WIW71326.1 nucleoside triphosphate pyrophosphohydrolase [Selenobaculum gbiensis]
MGEITIVGLGPGSFGYITMETWDKITSAETLLLRTAKHPTVEEMQARGVQFNSYDYVYNTKETFEEVYQTIANDCISRAQCGENIVYAVPGSPLVAEKTVVLIRELGKKLKVKVNILAGMSFIEVLYVRLGIDPIEGLTVIDSKDIDRLVCSTENGIVITQVYNSQVASDTKLSLMEIYPDDFKVTLIQNLGLPNEKIIEIALYELDRQTGIDHLTSLYIPPYKQSQECFDLAPLTDVMARLRSPGGCVWDIEQTHRSLRRNLIEEVYEVVEAIDFENAELLCEELGDLLLQIVFHARMAEETGVFSMQDVIDGITEKLIRRHPHVFGDVTVRDAGEVVLNWEEIKRKEKAKERTHILDGVPKDLPSLMRAYKLQHKAAKVGFDWDNITPVWDKIEEEIKELKEAIALSDPKKVEEELGDVIFSIVNLSRFLKVDAEIALNSTNNKFVKRFSYIENKLKDEGKSWKETALEELDKYWNEAKVTFLM